MVFNLFQTVLIFCLTSFTFFNLNFYTFLVICFEFYIKRTGDINSQIFLTEKSFTYDKYKTSQDMVWLWARFPYSTDMAFDVRTSYIFSQSIWHLRSGFYWYKVLQAVSHSEVRHCPQRWSACLSPHKSMFPKHQWRHTCFSCNTCRIVRDAPPSSSLQLSVQDGAEAPQT